MKNKLISILLLFIINYFVFVIYLLTVDQFKDIQKIGWTTLIPAFCALFVLPILAHVSIKHNRWIVHFINAILSVAFVGMLSFVLYSFLRNNPNGNFKPADVLGLFYLGLTMGIIMGGGPLIIINTIGFRLISNFNSVKNRSN
jgi:hypothetical protein